MRRRAQRALGLSCRRREPGAFTQSSHPSWAEDPQGLSPSHLENVLGLLLSGLPGLRRKAQKQRRGETQRRVLEGEHVHCSCTDVRGDVGQQSCLLKPFYSISCSPLQIVTKGLGSDVTFSEGAFLVSHLKDPSCGYCIP